MESVQYVHVISSWEKLYLYVFSIWCHLQQEIKLVG